jgi:hypothetical protein
MRAKIDELSRENERLRDERELEKAGGIDLNALDDVASGAKMDASFSTIKPADADSVSAKQDDSGLIPTPSPSAYLLSTRLFARMQQLREENESLGESLSSGRMGQLQEDSATMRTITEKQTKRLEGEITTLSYSWTCYSKAQLSP